MDGQKKFYVIGVGLSRTGTLSMKSALELLLPGKCHHMIDTFNYQEIWTSICDGKMNDDQFKDYFLSNGFVASVDCPCIFYYERLMKIFPEAKFILTVRDPTAWSKSMKTTICALQVYYKTFPIVIFHWLRFITKYLPVNTIMLWNVEKIDGFRQMVSSCLNNTGEIFYKKWENKIKEIIPKDRLLVLNVKDGWEPLCQFLEVPIPNESFPKLNDRQEFIERFHKQRNDGLKAVFQVFVVMLIIFASYVFLLS